eukprot:COSAG01_NODE_2836_length_6993_cov_9.416304_5_plen_77_part_00
MRRPAPEPPPRHTQETEFLELFQPFAARDRLMKGVDGFVEQLTAHLKETSVQCHPCPPRRAPSPPHSRLMPPIPLV